jgi:hypothetical protein
MLRQSWRGGSGRRGRVKTLPERGMMQRAGEIMTRRPRRNHSPSFEHKAALATIKGKKTLSELARRFEGTSQVMA